MAPLILWLVLFVVSLFVLVKSSDHFTTAAEKIGLHFRIPSFVVGVTLVAVGTSLPELASSLMAVFSDSSEVVSGVVIGSNISNLLLVIGVCAIISKFIKLSWNIEHIDLPFLIASAFFLFITMGDGVFTYVEGIVGLVLYIIYSNYVISTRKHRTSNALVSCKLDYKVVFTLIVSCFFIWAGAKYTIISLLEISSLMNIGKEIIALSAVALGTSLPELSVSVLAAIKKNSEMAVGNIVGSNIFNSLVVMGIPSLFSTLYVTKSIIAVSLPMMVIFTLFFYFIVRDKEITQWEGMILIVFYLLFLGNIFGIM